MILPNLSFLLTAALAPIVTASPAPISCRAPAPVRTDYFFRFIGGTTILNEQRLRGNISFDFLSPGALNPPFNPADHFSRLSTNASVPSNKAVLTVVPTNPHPPPVPGYYGLSGKEGIADAFRLVYTYRVDDEGATFKYKEWELKKSKASPGKVLLRYSGDAAGEWRWIARREKVFDGGLNKEFDKWVPWYVRPSAANVKVLEAWEYKAVDLELEVAKGNVNSGAPGGVEE
ncbi:band 3 anion exchange protein [Naviculisporaceae sp. PSN 640]